MTRWAVILAGGVGSRFWPLSTPARPKQLLPLVDREPLLANAVRRMNGIADPAHTLILTNAELRDAVARVVPGIPDENVIVEPRPSGTAAALAWAASEITEREKAGGDGSGVMVCIHADWSIADDAIFVKTLRDAASLAEARNALVTVGIVPTRPDTGFGYIEPGEATDGGFRVKRFIEKPDREGAKLLVDSGALWNSGIFCWRADDFLREVRKHTPEVAPALDQHATTRATRSRDEFFSFVRPISVDVGVLERSDNVFVVRGEFGWDDIGTWAALRRACAPDASGNVVRGTAHLLESRGNVVHAEDNAVVLYGVTDLVVVSRPGLTLVTTVEKSEELKKLVDSLPPEIKEIS